MKIQIRKFNERTDTRMLEYQPDRTIIHTAGGTMSSLFDQSEFLDVFTPEGIWVALNDETIIGAVLLGKYAERNPSCAAVYGIRVDEPYRSRGIGGVLLQKADMYARRNGIDQIILHTSPNNISAQVLCKKAGYIVVEETDDRLTLIKRVWIR